jgi:superfamily II DNA/RNA helicase
LFATFFRAPSSQRKGITLSEITFGALGVPAPLVKALAADGKTDAFPIQIDTLPDTMAGRDVLGRGKTGSGKTLAFSIPMVARLGTKLAGGRRRPGRPLGLVLAPTRELATQITAVLIPLADAYDLRVTTIFGGISQNRQVAALKDGVDIVVATPGRLEDLMKQGFLKLDAIEITVLDEADHMADLGFLPIVTRILNATPTDGQRLLFSATLDNGVDKIVSRFLHNEVLHSVDEANSPVAQMTHHVFETPSVEAKNDLIQALASGTGRRILFMRTKHHAKKLAKKLTEAGIPSVDLHGNLSQPQRDRNLAAFGEGSVRVLVATDVAARGVHVDDVELVIHVDPPMEHKAYLHRSGRTARAGAEGDVVTICLPPQKKDLAQLLRKADITVTPTAVHAQSPEVLALIGDVAKYVKPSIRVERPQGGGQSMGANAQRKRADRSGRPTEGGQRSRSGSGQGSRSGSRDGGSSQGSRSGSGSGSGQSYSTGYSDNSSQGSSEGRSEGRREGNHSAGRSGAGAPRRASSAPSGQGSRTRDAGAGSSSGTRESGASRGGYGEPVGMPRRDRSERPPRASRPQGR